MDHLEKNGTTEPNDPSRAVVRRRVLHVINGEHYAGAERVQDLLALTLPEQGYDVGFACVKPDVFPQQRMSQQSPLYQTRMRSKWDLRSVRSLAQIAMIGGYDLLHAHTTRSLLFTSIAARMAKKPFVYHVHSPTIQDSTRLIANKCNAWLERICLTGVSQLVCVSQSLADHMQTHRYDPRLIRVVPNGVPAHAELWEREPPRESWTLGTVALFRPRKGIEVLLEALAMVRSYGQDVRLRAVGDFESKEYESKVKAHADQLGLAASIDWVGFSQDVISEMRKTDAIVLPSLFGEGLPMVIIEAMGAGVPVIGTNVQGVPEVLTQGSGLIVEPGSAASLSHCIQKMVKGEVDWDAMRTNAWRRQAEHYSDRSMAAGVAQVYDDVLGDRVDADSVSQRASGMATAK